MRYVPNLIPPEAKIFPDYFKGSIYASKPANPPLRMALWTAAIVLFLVALGSLAHPLLAFIFGSVGILLLPPGKQWVQRKFRFQLTPVIRNITCTILFVIAVSLSSHYAVADTKASLAAQAQLEHEKAEKLVSDKKEKERKDSLAFYIEAGNLDRAAVFAAGESDKALIGKAQTRAHYQQLFVQIKQGAYAATLPAISDLISSDPSNTELLYQRAICYSKTGKIAEAVKDLAPLVQDGNADAIKLHDAINPLQKHVAYYTTRCRDGSSSSAKGRGACSAHGGVANWNEPVYETSRKY